MSQKLGFTLLLLTVYSRRLCVLSFHSRSFCSPRRRRCAYHNNCTTKVVLISVPSQYTHFELCVVDILSCGARKRSSACHWPPSSDSNQVTVQLFVNCNCINGLYLVNFPIISSWEFNLPNINWSHENCFRCCDATCFATF